MKLTFLGTGTSTGVPSVACDCETCLSDDARDKRLRVSVLVEHDGKTILVDTSSDFRQQALRAKIKRLDAILITHCHVDHVFGMDDIRPLNFRYGAMPIYADAGAWKDLRRIFQYIFEPSHFGGGLPQLIPHTIEKNAPFCFSENLLVTPLEVIHGKLPVIAYRFNDFAYATDLNYISEESMDGLQDLDVLVLDCVRIKPHATHLGLQEALEYIERLKPKRAYLTHLNHDVLYERDSKLLPENVWFAHDELVVED
ncbi:MAG: Metal-dependent hydrolases of the beta-lactamase superfamily I; PhnP protein [uncultured Pyrinomonadaceae bacterium]|uniref:Metal-dependent hydrolases of the beta-lactamase superfamily I PhnP protein n=1 Tax=uncultured Pyrinomonadaceae bacterium TaxID=2283094 RepID=A0A6J4NPP3_9BACT|nr:MAG: Metal-dependent hydrolases of the beta-lactamase superfamily I; PhnP protein [uncultured Pyrinomonadaceae bacterium]